MHKNTHIWLPSYIGSRLRRTSGRVQKPVHVIFCLVDHFEPKWNKPSLDIERRRIDAWVEKYPKLALRHRDSDGQSPCHTFFYPEEEYEKEHIDNLSSLCRWGFGEIEIHLHHDNDTAEGLRQKIEGFKKKLLRHNLLSRDEFGNVRYGFIHGNWSLDNSRSDGRWCGVNNELEVLRDTGCYADFTLPSAPSDTQTRKINSIYYAKDTPAPKSHDTGIDVEVGKMPYGDLMLIQGPLALNWRRRKFGLIPKLENSGITSDNPPTEDHVDLWIDQAIGVKRRPEWIFVKVYTHGAKDEHTKDEYFKQLDLMFGYLEEKYNDGSDYRLHYATAREMYNIVKAAEAGEAGNPGEYRDYVLRSNICDGVPQSLAYSG